MVTATNMELSESMTVLPIFSLIISPTGLLYWIDLPMSPLRSFPMYLRYCSYHGRSKPSSLLSLSTFSTLTFSLLSIRLMALPGAKDTMANTMNVIPKSTGMVINMRLIRYLLTSNPCLTDGRAL